MNTMTWIVAGVFYVALVILITRILTPKLQRFLPWFSENIVYATTLVLTSLRYFRWARAGGEAADVTTELVGLAVFGTLAVVGLRWPLVLALAWLVHAGWDWILHPMPETSWVPSWFPDLCVGFDLPLAIYIAMRARVPARTSAAAPVAETSS